ncbi:hypothetical protein [Mycolicibacterium sp. GF69]|uniref:hypothetical protein n=1 Tax=Mycolicibacterium sp. GF69 TaxID=2267251 RepID=UPI001401F46E|nr:hypothetical protein [Mycolicibacterium sp. GF69]
MIRDVGSGGIEFGVQGERFSISNRTGLMDLVLWTRLETLGARMNRMYGMIPTLGDPDH